MTTLKSLVRRHSISQPTGRAWIRRVQAAASPELLQPGVLHDITRPSAPNEDHLRRVRIAQTFRLTAPTPPPPPPRPDRRIGASHRAAARVAVHLLAAVGSLPLDSVFKAVNRNRRFRHGLPLNHPTLASALIQQGCTIDPDGTVHPPPGAEAPDRYLALAAATPNRDLTRQEMIALFVSAAGYAPNSAGGLLATSHPLFTHVGPDRYRLVGSAR